MSSREEEAANTVMPEGTEQEVGLAVDVSLHADEAGLILIVLDQDAVPLAHVHLDRRFIQSVAQMVRIEMEREVIVETQGDLTEIDAQPEPDLGTDSYQ